MKGWMILLLLFSVGNVLATCTPEVTLLNQDPYPAVPGDYVKLIFQIEGLDDSECEDFTIELLEDYPIEFDPGKTGLRTFEKVRYIKDYESNILVPYEVRVNTNALDGANPIEVRTQLRGGAQVSRTYDLEVDDSRTDFEVYIKDYDYITKELTIEVLNVGDSDIEALTIEIPKQSGISVKGSNRVVVGDLDSNEYTSADFETTAEDGEIQLKLIYSDSINVRRTLEKTVTFDSSYYKERVSDVQNNGYTSYIILGVIVLIIIYIIYKKVKKSKKKRNS